MLTTPSLETHTPAYINWAEVESVNHFMFLGIPITVIKTTQNIIGTHQLSISDIGGVRWLCRAQSLFSVFLCVE